MKLKQFSREKAICSLKSSIVRVDFTLILIILLAVLVRTWGIEHGSGYQLHPDEPKFVLPAIQISNNIKSVFSNPSILLLDDFFYPHFLIYFLSLFFVIINSIFNLLEFIPFMQIYSLKTFDYFIIARFVSVLFSVASVYYTFRIASRFLSKNYAYLSSLLFAFSYYHVVQSHFFLADVPSTLLILMILDMLLSLNSLNYRFKIVLISILLGIAIGTKYYPVLLIIPLIVKLYCTFPIKKFVQILSFVLVCAFVIFLITTPSILFYPEIFYSDFATSSMRSSQGNWGAISPSIFGYFFSDNIAYAVSYSKNNLYDGLGALYLITALVGFLLYMKSYLKDKSIDKVIILTFFILHFVFFSRYDTKIIRWMIPLAPLFALFAANAINNSKSTFIRILVLTLIVIFSIQKIMIFDIAASRVDSRVLILDFITKNIPFGAKILSDPFITIPNSMNTKYKFVFLSFPKYLSDLRPENSQPPATKIDGISQIPDYAIISSSFRGRFLFDAGLDKELLKKWNEFYDSIESRHTQIYEEIPNSSDNIRTGPEIRIYKINHSLQ